MNVLPTTIPDVKIIEPRVLEDARGYFFESFSQKLFNEKMSETVFVQDYESRSTYCVLCGLPFQRPPMAQDKLVRVVEGSVLDVAVDIRNDSPTYGQYVSVELSAENKRQLFIPVGFAHGYVVLSPTVVFQYKCDNYYSPAHEGGIAWNDPDLNID
jgi:dTDP-4-dehydrorhamnose 3,5-epimerase